MELITSGAGAAAGVAAGKVISSKIQFLQQNPIVGAGAQVALAIVVSGMGRGKNSFANAVAVGMTGNAIVSLLNATAPQVTSQLGISGMGNYPGLPYSGSTATIPGVAGMNGGDYTKFNY